MVSARKTKKVRGNFQRDEVIVYFGGQGGSNVELTAHDVDF